MLFGLSLLCARGRGRVRGRAGRGKGGVCGKLMRRAGGASQGQPDRVYGEGEGTVQAEEYGKQRRDLRACPRRRGHAEVQGEPLLVAFSPEGSSHGACRHRRAACSTCRTSPRSCGRSSSWAAVASSSCVRTSACRASAEVSPARPSRAHDPSEADRVELQTRRAWTSARRSR